MRVAALSSFGKDSLYAIYKYGMVDVIIVTEIEFPRISPHILNFHIAELASKYMGIPLRKVKLRKGKEKEDLVSELQNFDKVIAGNIFLEEHRQWLEDVASKAGVDYEEPLWNYDTQKLLLEIISAGFEPLIVGLDPEKIDKKYLGKILDGKVAEYIFSLDIDPCGEYGEYHTMAINAPMYARRIDVDGGDIFFKNGYGLFKAKISKNP